MERMKIVVTNLESDEKNHRLIAQVTAISCRKLGHAPVANIEIKIALCILANESRAAARRRARDEAMMFLDIQ